jgi:hypothetical protein
MVTIKCDTCDLKFGVENEFVIDGKVTVLFHCPYCSQKYPKGYYVELVGVTGGVNISGSAHVGGSIVGGDLVIRK